MSFDFLLMSFKYNFIVVDSISLAKSLFCTEIVVHALLGKSQREDYTTPPGKLAICKPNNKLVSCGNMFGRFNFKNVQIHLTL